MSLGRFQFLYAPVVSGVLLWLSFPKPSWHFLAWFALVPYLYFLLMGCPTWKRVLVAHFLFSWTFLGGLLYWIPEVINVYGGLGQGTAAGVFVLLLCALSLLMLPFSLLTRWIAARSLRYALIAAPVLWVFVEVLRKYHPAGGFPWGSLAYSQYSYLWIAQLADVGGVLLISYLIVMGNCALVSLILRRDWLYPAIFFSLFLTGNLYGIYRIHVWDPPRQESVKVSLVQAGIELQGTREYYARLYFEELPAYYSQGADAGADLVVFAEAPNPFYFEKDYYFTTFWRQLVAESGVPLIFNGTARDSAGEEYFNSAFFLNREGEATYRYDKVHLVPFGEYLPWGKILGFAEPLVQQVGGFSAGRESTKPGLLGAIPFSTLICYEAIFPRLSRLAAWNGSQLLVNITNDAWFGRTAAARQHLEIAAFRAIETRKPFVRCANTGYSTIIDPKGRILQISALFEKGTLIGEVWPNDYRTLYTVAGEWAAVSLIMLFTALLVLIPMRVKKRRG